MNSLSNLFAAPSELPGAEISRRMLAEQVTPDRSLKDPPPPDGPPADDHGTDGERSIAGMYEPLDWHALWATTSDEPDWLVPDVLERGRLHAVYAPKKHKKSLLTLVIVASLVTGRPLLGRPNPHGRSLRVLYVDVENSRDDIRQRLQDAGYGPADLENLVYLSFPSLPGLDSVAGGQHLVALVQRYKPDLVVLDTTSRVVVGKENDADTFRSLYRHALAPIKARGIAVLRLDHAGKDPTLGQRGSSAKGDDLDTAWLLTIGGQGRLTMRLEFQRTNHHPPEIELVEHRGPLRFARIDAASDRPEVAALLAKLESLGVPLDAGRPAAQKVLAAAGVRATAAVLAEAIKIRKSCSEDQRTAPLDDDLPKIIYRCSGPDNIRASVAGRSQSEQSANSPNSADPSGTGGTVRDFPVSRSAQGSEQPPRTSPEQQHPAKSAEPGTRNCSRCKRPAERLVAGRCPPCAYPAEDGSYRR